MKFFEALLWLSMAWLTLSIVAVVIFLGIREVVQLVRAWRGAKGKPLVRADPPTWTVTFFGGAVAIPLHVDVPQERLLAAHCFLRLSRLGWNRPEVRA